MACPSAGGSMFDAVIVGSGAVGVAVARELSLVRGLSTVICEKNSDPISEASSGNTGHFASFFYYTRSRAPLEYAITRKAAEINGRWLEAQINVPRRRCGLLLVAFSPEEESVLVEMAAVAKENGEKGVRIVGREQIRNLEPNMCMDGVVSGLFSSNETVVDPWLLAMSNLHGALESGRCQLRLGCEVLSLKRAESRTGVDTLWEVETSKGRIFTKRVINCAGNYSDEISKMSTPDPTTPRFRIRPRKGQFLVYSAPSSSKNLVRTMVAPVPMKSSAGVYVFQSVNGEIVVGPTNEQQDSKTDRTCDEKTLAMLSGHAESLFPDLCESERIGSFSGLRPACEDPGLNDYQIHFEDEDLSFITVGGIRSTGLTASRAIAEHVAEEMMKLGKAKGNNQDIVMPEPEFMPEGKEVKIGTRSFKVSHFLTQKRNIIKRSRL